MSSISTLRSEPERLASVLTKQLPSPDPARYIRLLERLEHELGVGPDADVWLASSPGRTELAGNHTDHNHGKVLAASIPLDSVAAAAPRSDSTVRLSSEGYPLVEVDISDTNAHEGERDTTAALVRGMAAGFAKGGHRTGGFDAAITSTVLPGSGLSSSASIEVLIGVLLNALYNDGALDSTQIAKIGQFAENSYFGKPSGLMDQVACATGGAVTIDFADTRDPQIERIDVSFEEAGLALLVVDTGANHADLTDEYAAIPADMRAIAGALGGDVLRDVTAETFHAAIPLLRREIGDRAVARGIHFFDENRRVEQMVEALRRGDTTEYLALMADSGRSSGIYLQNCVPVSNPGEQGVVIALALTEHFFASRGLRNGRDAACRVHGGGFAGTIQVLLPSQTVDAYNEFLGGYLDERAATRLGIRAVGAVGFPG